MPPAHWIVVPYLGCHPSPLLSPSCWLSDNFLNLANRRLTGWGQEIYAGVMEDGTPVSSEDDQQLTFSVTTNKPVALLFSQAPTITHNGDLSFTLLPGVSGIVPLHVVLLDDGGKDHGGTDTSYEYVLNLEVVADEEAPRYIDLTSVGLTVKENAEKKYFPGLLLTEHGNFADYSKKFTIETSWDPVFDKYFAVSPSFDLNGVLSFQPAPHVFGNVSVSVTGTDVDLRTAKTWEHSFTFVIRILSVNREPGFSLLNSTIYVKEDECSPAKYPYVSARDISLPSCTFSGFATNIVQGPRNYILETWNEFPQWAELQQQVTFTVLGENDVLNLTSMHISSIGELIFSLMPHQNGRQAFSLYLSDDGGVDLNGVDRSIPQTFYVVVLPVNDPPFYALNCSASSALTCQGMCGDDASEDTCVLDIIVDEGCADCASLGTVAGCDDGQPGVLISGFASSIRPSWSSDAIDEVNQTMAFSFEFAEGDVDILSQVSVDAITGALTFCPSSERNGELSFKLWLLDNGGNGNGGMANWSSTTVHFTVRAINDAPSFELLSPTVGFINEDSGSSAMPGFATHLSSGPIYSHEEQQTMTFILTLVESSPLNIGLALFGGVVPEISPNGTLTFDLAPEVFGNVTFTVVLQDDGGVERNGEDTSEPATFTIVVLQVNHEPEFTLTEMDGPILEDSAPFEQAGFAIDISRGTVQEDALELQQLTFVLTLVESSPLDVGLALFGGVYPEISPDGTLSFAPQQLLFGTAKFEVVLKDDGGVERGGRDVSEVATMTIDVLFVNHKPKFDMVDFVPVLEDSGAFLQSGFAVEISRGTPQEDALLEQQLSFTLTMVESSPLDIGLALFGGVVPEISPNGTLTFDLAPEVFGNVTFTVVLQDDGGVERNGEDTSEPATFTIVVLQVNHEPEFTLTEMDGPILEDSAPFEQAGFAIDISRGTVQEDALELQQLTFVLTLVESSPLDVGLALFGGVYPEISPDGTLSFAPQQLLFGTAKFEVVLKDDGGVERGGRDVSEVATMTIDVLFVNHKPKFDMVDFVPVLEDSGAFLQSGFAVEISRGTPQEDALLEQQLSFTLTMVESSPLDIGLALFGGVVPEISPNGTLTFDLAPEVFGNVTFTVVLQDDGGVERNGEDTSEPATFTIVVLQVNHEPEFTLTEMDGPILEDSAPFEQAGFAIDISRGTVQEDALELQQLTFVLTLVESSPLDVGLALFGGVYPEISPDGTLSFAPQQLLFGTAKFEVVLKDDGGVERGGRDVSEVATMTIDVLFVNHKPKFDMVDFVPVLEDSGAFLQSGFAVEISRGTPQEDALLEQQLSFTLTMVESSPLDIGLALFGGVVPEISPNGTLTFDLAPEVFGNVTFTVVLQDDGGVERNGEDTSEPATFTIVVLQVNHEPEFTLTEMDGPILEDSAPFEQAGFAIDISRGTAQEDDLALRVDFPHLVQEITFAVTLLSDEPFGLGNTFFSVLPHIDETGTLKFQTAENVWGSVTASVMLHDSGGVERGGSATSPEQTFTISIAPVNQAPLFSLNQSVLLGIGLPSIGEPFIFQVSEDADCAPRPGFAAGIVPSPDPNFEAHQSVSFRFEQVDGENDLFTAPVEMTASGTLLLCPAANRNGEAKFALTLLDDGGTQNGGQDVSDAVELTIIVLPVNDLPTFSAPAEVVFLESQHEGPTAVVIEQLTGNHSGGPLDESQNITFVLQPVQSQVPETTQESVPRPITTGAAGQVSCLFAGNSWSNHRSEGQLSGNDAAGLAARYPYSGVLERGTLCEAGAALGMTWEGKVQQKLFLSQDCTGGSVGTRTWISARTSNGTACLAFATEDNSTASLLLQYSCETNEVTEQMLCDGSTCEEKCSLHFARTLTDTGVSELFEAGEPQQLFANGSEVVVSPSGILTLELAQFRNGIARFLLFADDGEDLSLPHVLDIRIVPVNSQPTFELVAGLFHLREHHDDQSSVIAPFITSMHKGGWREQDQTLSFAINQISGPHGLAGGFSVVCPDGHCLGRHASLEFWSPSDRFGGITFEVTLFDDGGDQNWAEHNSTQEFSVEVMPVNEAPVFRLAASVVTVQEDSCGSQDAYASDTFVVSPCETPGSRVHSIRGFAQSISLGRYENGPGECEANPVSECESQTGNFTVVSIDPAFAALVFDVKPYIEWPSGDMHFELQEHGFGRVELRVVLADYNALDNTTLVSRELTFAVDVLPVNNAPVFMLLNDVSTSESANGTGHFEQLIAQGVAADAFGREAHQQLSFRVELDDLGRSMFTEEGQPRIRIDGTQAWIEFEAAEFAFGLTVGSVVLTDDGGIERDGVDESRAPITIQICPVNQAPSFDITRLLTVPEVAEPRPEVVTRFALGITPGPSNEACVDVDPMCQQQSVTFMVEDNTNPSLFVVQPRISREGILSFSLAAHANGAAAIDVALYDDGESLQPDGCPSYAGDNRSPTESFVISVTPINDSPQFELPFKLDCTSALSMESCHCGLGTNPATGPFCSPLSASSLLYSEVRVLQGSGTAAISHFATPVTPAEGFLTSHDSLFEAGQETVYQNYQGVLSFREAYSMTLLSASQNPVTSSRLARYATDFVEVDDSAAGSGVRLYAAEYETDSVTVLELADDGEFSLLDRRADNETRLRFVPFGDFPHFSGSNKTVSATPCGWTRFEIDGDTYALAVSGCDLLADVQLSGSADRSTCQESGSSVSCDAVEKVLESAVGNWDFRQRALRGEQRVSDFSEGQDVQCTSEGCVYTRTKRGAAEYCNEAHSTRVFPATFEDVAGVLGAAVMVGPYCKGSALQTDWDVASDQEGLSAALFLTTNGREEALQFDGVLNDGLVVSDDIGTGKDPMISRLPTQELSLEAWFSPGAAEVPYAGLLAALQDQSGCRRGWFLGYDRRAAPSETSTIYFSLSLAAHNGEALETLAFSPPVATAQGAWSHVLVTYDPSPPPSY